MSEDWTVGDLALCLKRGIWIHSNSGRPTGSGPKYNDILRVRRVGANSKAHIVLWFDSYEGDGVERSYSASRFRKIKPDTEPCEEEFIVLVKRGRKVSA